jgi:inhibitor of KinA
VNNTLAPLGDSALLIHLGDDIEPALNRRVHALDALLHARLRPGIVELVPAYGTLLVHYDPLVLTYAQVSAWAADHLDEVLDASAQPARRIDVPVRYGGEHGPDLRAVAEYHHASPDEIVGLHTSREYTVFMMGFTPGFPYMGRLDEALVTPRLQTPRTRVPAGSVGIAGAQTGIYPIESPGGWQIIGRTQLRLFDLSASEPFLFAPGDRVRFIREALDV